MAYQEKAQEMFDTFLRSLCVSIDVSQVIKSAFILNELGIEVFLISELRKNGDSYYADAMFLLHIENTKNIMTGRIEIINEKMYVRLGDTRYEIDFNKIKEHAKYCEDE